MDQLDVYRKRPRQCQVHGGAPALIFWAPFKTLNGHFLDPLFASEWAFGNFGVPKRRIGSPNGAFFSCLCRFFGIKKTRNLENTKKHVKHRMDRPKWHVV